MSNIQIVSFLLVAVVTFPGVHGEPACPGGQKWTACGTCDKTCGNPHAACLAVCGKKCQCPPDKPIWHQNKCILLEECKKVVRICGNTRSCDAYWYFGGSNSDVAHWLGRRESWWVHPGQPYSCRSRALLTLNPLLSPTVTNLTIDMCLENPTGYTFNIGDSPSNDGHCGDYEETTGEAEIHNYEGNNLLICRNYTLDNYPPTLELGRFRNGVGSGLFTVKINKPNPARAGYVGINNYNGIDVDINEATLFNWDQMYLGINRVINGVYRSGTGLCAFCIRWN